MKKYRLLTVQFDVSISTFKKMIAISYSESNPMTKGAIVSCISLSEEVEEEDIKNLIIINSMEISYEEYLTF